jgi:simple sugar transport system permease protein
MGMAVVLEFLNSMIRVSVPVILVAIGVCFSEKSGVFAMGSEGYMLISAFVSVVVMIQANNHFVAIMSGIIAGMLVSAIFSYFTVVLGADQVICGLGSNFVMLGLTSSLQRLFWGTTGIPRIAPINPIPIPLLSDIPFIGGMLFNQPFLTYVTYALIPIGWWLMFRSSFGLNLRAVGENPGCADTLGIGVKRMRITGVVIGGAFCGLGGAVLALSQVQSFTENISGGRGWLGLIAATFGGWNPLAASGAGLIFGAAESLQLRLQIFSKISISSYVILMIPYIVALIFIMFVGKSKRHPAGIGKHYRKQ